jgi:hypothetical protein
MTNEKLLEAANEFLTKRRKRRKRRVGATGVGAMGGAATGARVRATVVGGVGGGKAPAATTVVHHYHGGGGGGVSSTPTTPTATNGNGNGRSNGNGFSNGNFRGTGHPYHDEISAHHTAKIKAHIEGDKEAEQYHHKEMVRKHLAGVSEWEEKHNNASSTEEHQAAHEFHSGMANGYRSKRFPTHDEQHEEELASHHDERAAHHAEQMGAGAQATPRASAPAPEAKPEPAGAHGPETPKSSAIGNAARAGARMAGDFTKAAVKHSGVGIEPRSGVEIRSSSLDARLKSATSGGIQPRGSRTSINTGDKFAKPFQQSAADNGAAVGKALARGSNALQRGVPAVARAGAHIAGIAARGAASVADKGITGAENLANRANAGFEHGLTKVAGAAQSAGASLANRVASARNVLRQRMDQNAQAAEPVAHTTPATPAAGSNGNGARSAPSPTTNLGRMAISPDHMTAARSVIQQHLNGQTNGSSPSRNGSVGASQKRTPVDAGDTSDIGAVHEDVVISEEERMRPYRDKAALIHLKEYYGIPYWDGMKLVREARRVHKKVRQHNKRQKRRGKEFWVN